LRERKVRVVKQRYEKLRLRKRLWVKRREEKRVRELDRAFMVEENLPGPLERAVVLCRGAATNCYDMPSPTGARERRE
jgi:hypothetical protein